MSVVISSGTNVAIIRSGAQVALVQGAAETVVVTQTGPAGAGGGGGGVTDGDKGDIVVTVGGTVWSVKSALLASAGSATIAAHLAALDPHPQYALDSDLVTAIGTREPTIAAGTTSQYWRGDKSWQTLNKGAVGLGNVDNTADANKPLFTDTVRGLVPASGGGTTSFLRADGTFAAPPGGGGGSPGGSDRQVQFNNAGAFAGASELVVGSDGGTAIVTGAFDSALPSVEAGRLKMFSKSKAGRSLLAVMGPSGLDTAIQSHFALNTIRIYKPTFFVTTATNIGFPSITLLGTATAAVWSSTNLFTRTPRVGILSAAVAASQCGIRTATSNTGQHTIRTGYEGWFLVFRAGIIATASDRQLYIGIHSLTLSFITGEPSTGTNFVALGMDSTDTNLHIMHNDGSGSATKVDLGSSFPAPVANQDFYELRLYQAPGASQIGWFVENLTTGAKSEGVISTNQPAIGTGLSAAAALSNAATASSVQLGIAGIYLETDF